MTSTGSYLDELAANGVDTRDGLQRVLGNGAFYLQLLEGFHARQQDAAGRIRVALDQGNLQLAERLAHTLKGAAGAIGAATVHELAGELEEQLRRHAAPSALRLPLDRLEGELLRVMTALSRMPRSPYVTQDAPPSGTEPTSGIMQRLAQMLESADVEAIDMLTQYADALVAALGGESYRHISAAAREYEFDVALGLLRSGAKAAGYEKA